MRFLITWQKQMMFLGIGTLAMIVPSVVSLSSANIARTTPTTTTTTTTGGPTSKRHPDPTPGVDWDSFKFSLNGVRTGFMWMDRVPVDDASYYNDASSSSSSSSLFSSSTADCLQPLAPFEISPMSTVLNYAQCVFEGLKAFRREDGSIGIFRPDRNALRMQQSAERFLLPPVPTSIFLQATHDVVRANAAWVPPPGRGSLYLRPMLMGTAEGLGASASAEATFCVYGSPVGNYFKGGLTGIRLQAVKGYGRAAPGGSGSVKASGNYAPIFLLQRQVKQRGYDDVLCLDPISWEAIEEAGTSNFFAVFPDNTLVTPSLADGTILAGVTRASILELAQRECGLQVVERRLTLQDLKRATEAFCCGTGASVSPVGHISVVDRTTPHVELDQMTFGDGKTPGPITKRLYNMLLDIQLGTDDAALGQTYADWIQIVEP